MMKSWGIIKNNPIEKNKDFEKFISKMMEMERACIEEGDQRPIVFLRKDFLECRVEIIKKNGERWTYILNPFGYEGNWEIFDVVRI